MMNKTAAVCLALVVSFLAACSFLLFSDDEIVQSRNDKREYQALKLENGLQVLLVSDAEADFAAASLDVFVGSGDDPQHRQGLAHFLEHMLFLGTQKYPQADEYQAFIKENGGGHNAYTSFEHTNYFFSVQPQALEPALDRFAQFFISPLFNEEYVEREKHAVNAEYRARINNEARRSLDVLKTQVNPEHPFVKFSVGNLQTLSSDQQSIREDLLAFYRQYYAASNMRLVVSGNQSLAELKLWVEQKFSSVPDFEVEDQTVREPLFADGYLPKWLHIKPYKSIRDLTLYFPLPDLQPYYHSKPLTLIGHILGHEGKGSLFSWLKEKSWVESLSAGQGIRYQGGSSFTLSIELTDEGLKHQQAIVVAVFEAIKRLQDEGVPRWVFDEVAQVKQMGFDYQESADAQHYVMRLSNALHYYPVNEVLVADYLLNDYQPQLINRVLQQLVLDNCLLTTVADSFEPQAESPFYATPYRVDEISPVLKQKVAEADVNPQIRLPQANPLLAESTELLVEQVSGLPALIHQQPGAELWYKGIDDFEVPKASAYYSFQNGRFRTGVEQVVLLELYVALLNDTLNEWIYPARMAGLGFQLYPHKRGISLKLDGFSDKQDELLMLIAKQISQAEFTEAQFNRLKAELQRNWLNAQKQPPYIKLSRHWRQQMQPQVWAEADKLNALADVSLLQLDRFALNFWKDIQLQALSSGNHTQPQALKMLETLLAAFPVKPGKVPPLAVHDLPQQALQQQIISEHNDTGYLLYWQAQNNSVKTQAEWMLLAKVLEAGFFNQLRTEQQFGYIVYERYVPLLTVPGMLFVVQSPHASVVEVHDAVQLYLRSAPDQLKALSEEQFASFKAGLIQRLLEQPKNLSQESAVYWYELALAQGFELDRKLAEQIDALTLSAWRKAMQLQLQGRGAQLLLTTGDVQLDGYKRVDSLRAVAVQPGFEYVEM